MTTTAPAPEPDQQPDQSAGTDSAPTDTDDAGLGREAAKYRRQLRNVEQERDTLAGRVETMQRQEVERIAATDLAAPGDLWSVGGADLAALLDDDGHVDEGKVAIAVSALVEQRPGLRPPQGAPHFDGGARETPATGPGWAEVLRGRR